MFKLLLRFSGIFQVYMGVLLLSLSGWAQVAVGANIPILGSTLYIEGTTAAGERVSKIWSRDQIMALPNHSLVTSTTWTDGKPVFKGVLVRELIDATGIALSPLNTVHFVAYNGYEVGIEATDFLTYDVLLAYEMNTQPLTLRDMGPYRVVYPRDQHPELQSTVLDYRWPWQVRRIVVK